MRTASVSDNPRNSFTAPTAHLAASSFARFVFFIVMLLLGNQLVILSKPPSAGLNDRWRRLFRRLLKHIENDNRVSICPVYDAKRASLIVDPQPMVPKSNDRHKP
jgi:hypothetical protein